jgi:hypothetical protein
MANMTPKPSRYPFSGHSYAVRVTWLQPRLTCKHSTSFILLSPPGVDIDDWEMPQSGAVAPDLCGIAADMARKLWSGMLLDHRLVNLLPQT